MGSPAVCCVCDAAVVAVTVVVAAAAVAAAVAGSLADMRHEAKELIMVCPLGTCASAMCVVDSGTVEMVDCRVLGVVFCLCK